MPSPTRSLGVAAVLAAAATAATHASGPAGVEYFLIDFEGLPESTPVDDQYAAVGVTFELEGMPGQFPIIAVEGNPRVAFAGSGSDRDMSSGIAGLTDPEVDTDHTIPADIRMRFDPPASNVRFYYIDLDDAPVTVTAFDASGAPLESITKSPGDPDAGNNRSTEFSFAMADIASILVDVGDVAPVQYALDYITFTRPCTTGDCGQLIEVAQESEPGIGDFDANVLGAVVAYPTTISPIQFFAYNVPEDDSWNGAVLTPEADRSHLVFSSGPADLSLFVIHDRAIPNDPDGGRAEMTFEVQGDPNGAFVSVRDDPGNQEAGAGYVEVSPNFVQAGWDWGQCCTDGLSLSGIDAGATLLVSFDEFDGNPNTEPIEGLTEWVLYSADGSELALALEVGRRVRFRTPSVEACPADVDENGTVGFEDLLAVLAAWGACP